MRKLRSVALSLIIVSGFVFFFFLTGFGPGSVSAESSSNPTPQSRRKGDKISETLGARNDNDEIVQVILQLNARPTGRLNALLFRMAGGRKYATFFFGRYSPVTGELRYVNAGHNPPFLVTEDMFEEIKATGRPIGILPEAEYEERSIAIPPGAMLFLYTDGLNEAANRRKKSWDGPPEGIVRRFAMPTPRARVERTGRIVEFEDGAHATDDKRRGDARLSARWSSAPEN